jgi:polysaccharide export outer membrane protein
VAGLTVAELESTLTTALADGYLRNPQVSVQVLEFRPFFILGEVNEPGRYAYSGGLTVLNAVATAGGFTYRANQDKFTAKRSRADGSSTEVTLQADDLVQPGDILNVKERWF